MLNLPQMGIREQFHLANGGDAECVIYEGYCTYSNGARMQNCRDGMFMDPHPNVYERTKTQLYYHRVRQKFAREKFTEWKQQCTWAVSAAERSGGRDPGPSSQDIERLEALQAEVQKCDAKVREYEELLEGLKPEWMRRSADVDARNREAVEAAREAINRIKV